MRLTAKSSYALNIIGHLAEKHQPIKKQNEQCGPISASEIASEYGLSEAFVTSILREMKLAGLVTPKKGPGGGYTLSKSASKITVKHVFDAIEEKPLNYQMSLFENGTGKKIIKGLDKVVATYLKQPISEFAA